MKRQGIRRRPDIQYHVGLWISQSIALTSDGKNEVSERRGAEETVRANAISVVCLERPESLARQAQ
jgi:hypothetical protein